MQIEEIRLRNFRAFRDATMRDIPRFAVIIGANGSGKSTLFSAFGFLREAMNSNVTTALAKLGGSRGFEEVRSRDSEGPIEFEVKYRPKQDSPLMTYLLQVSLEKGKAVVEREILKYRRGSGGAPWHFIDFKNGSGEAVTNEVDEVTDVKQLNREEQTLKSPDVLAIKGLAQFERFPATVALGELIEKWHISDFYISKARTVQRIDHAEHLSTSGDNLSLVIEYLYKNHPESLKEIIKKMSERIPGIQNVEAKQTEDGRILLKFQDRSFEDPFLAGYVSDGTIKILAYLTLLHDPKPSPLLCVEEPENQLYPSLLPEIAEEFRSYALRGGQVFVSTHSEGFLNAARLEEVFLLRKKDGYTTIDRAQDDDQVSEYMNNGDQMGHIWSSGVIDGVDP